MTDTIGRRGQPHENEGERAGLVGHESVNLSFVAAYQQWRETRLLNPDTSITAYQRELAAYAALKEKEEQQ